MITCLFLHWFGDFVCQSDKMAINKSKSNFWLSMHVLVYTAVLMFLGWKIALINGIAHWIIDYFTSRLNAWLWAKEERHWFFVSVGFDQFLHVALLWYTWMVIK